MKVINNSIYNLSHDVFEANQKVSYRLEIGSFLDVPQEVADKWLKIEGVKPYVTPEDLEAEKAKAVEEALKVAKAEKKEPVKKAATKKITKKY